MRYRRGYETNVDFVDNAKKFIRISEGNVKSHLEQLTKPEVAQLIAELQAAHAQMVDV